MRQRLQRQLITLAGIVVFLGLGASPATGQGPGGGKGPKHKVPPGQAKAKHAFRTTDHDTFRNYFRTHRIAVTPLPPGIARQIARGKPLPPGLARRPLPRELVVLVPPPEPGYDYAIVGNQIVMLDVQGLVVDIQIDIFP
ncbi:MAG TPA: hypothetical protein VGP87_02780 [Gemmatimonadales bacterium]|nr:hypothetical protein [Gemmatimonadales bacterium]